MYWFLNSSRMYRCRNLTVFKDNDQVGIFTEETRCAMMIFVVFGISSRKALWISASVLVSTALVESSRIRIFGFFSRARAIHLSTRRLRFAGCAIPLIALNPPKVSITSFDRIEAAGIYTNNGPELRRFESPAPRSSAHSLRVTTNGERCVRTSHTYKKSNW